MNKKIVVENTLNPYIDSLEKAGYNVYKLYKNENLKNITSNEYEAIVVSGLENKDMNGTSYQNPPAPIIEAKGKTPEEIINIIENNYK